MIEKHFKSWLYQKYPLPAGTAITRFNNCKKIETHHGDLDRHYDRDGLSSLARYLTYSIDDKRAGQTNPSKIPLHGRDLYNNLAMYRAALSLYKAFRDAPSAPMPMLRGRPTPPRSPRISNASWPRWNAPGDAHLLQFAHVTIPYIAFCILTLFAPSSRIMRQGV